MVDIILTPFFVVFVSLVTQLLVFWGSTKAFGTMSPNFQGYVRAFCSGFGGFSEEGYLSTPRKKE